MPKTYFTVHSLGTEAASRTSTLGGVGGGGRFAKHLGQIQ